jgi:GxxExxY protein
MLRVKSPLTSEQEKIVESAIDATLCVHRALGPGFKEIIYKRAYLLELDSRKLKFESEKKILVRYKEWEIPGQTVDLIVEGIVLTQSIAETATDPSSSGSFIFEDHRSARRASCELQCVSVETRVAKSCALAADSDLEKLEGVVAFEPSCPSCNPPEGVVDRLTVS